MIFKESFIGTLVYSEVTSKDIIISSSSISISRMNSENSLEFFACPLFLMYCFKTPAIYLERFSSGVPLHDTIGLIGNPLYVAHENRQVLSFDMFHLKLFSGHVGF